MQNFSDRLEQSVKKKKSCLLLGLDPNTDLMPESVSKDADGAYTFCKSILDATEDLICGVKIQMAYFEVFGAAGIEVVEKLLQDAKDKGLITIVDGKRNDIGSTAWAYAKAYLGDGPLSCDAITVNPLLGTDGMEPFVELCEQNGRGLFVLVRTSNPSSAEFQGREDLCVAIAEKVEEWNVTTQSEHNQLASIGAVLGATLPAEMLKFFREEMPHAWFLCPGVGAQGGDMEAVLASQVNGLGVLIPVSRAVLYAGAGEDYADKAREAMVELKEGLS